MKPEKIERRPSSEERLEVLRDLFPEVFTDGRVNVERLREVLEDSASDAPDTEHYGLRWPGKQQARRLANQPPHVTLRPVPKAGVDEDTTGNMVIVGDNLQVLLALQKSYASSIKLIYIDPPYNTGNDFIYKDNFAVDEELYLQDTRQADLHGRLVSNPQTSGRFHSNWLNFMYPRLRVARSLLRDDGAIFISIDDHEVHNLRHLMDEIFGAENFKTDVIWQKRYTRSNNTVDFTTVVEHILVYARSDAFTVNLLPRSDEADARYTNPDNDPRGPWKGASFLNPATPDERPNLCYPLVNPTTGETTLPTKNAWRRSKEEFQRLQSEGLLYWGKDGRSAVPSIKMFLSESRGLTPINFWDHKYAGNTDDGTRDLAVRVPGKVFDNPKPVQLIRRIIEHVSSGDDIILDFFAGSGTTGDAVFQHNAEDGGTRRFILVQVPEGVDGSDYQTIDQITCERLRRASTAMKAEGVKGDLGFRVFKEDSPALARPLHLAAEQLEKGQLAMFKEKLAHIQPADLFTEVLLLLGFPLDAKREQVPQDSANTLWRFENPRVPQPLLLCLDPKVDDDLLDALRDKKNHIFVCRDEALTDVAKARFYDALKLADSTFKVL
ncbi:site-specific DNA-methyltransferase [Archangium violaceum]|uniref:site-specific DNA-methyltransferase n=1 Tax=Archangium violaceum TaxID=83451 RepID=UPI0019525ED6|nr:site-specific DNA-methyltransferase [Archangium violaceum]QRN94062.1 site-specific DNA-methyltransferase [Archangium violaceum]